MAKVTITALERVAKRLGFEGRQRARFSQEIGEGETLDSLVRRLAASHPSFADNTFSPASDAMVPDYRVHVNGTVIPLFDWPTTVLKHGDRILLRRMS